MTSHQAVETVDLRSFDPFGAHVASIYQYLEHARESEPIFYSEPLQAWCVTRYDDIKKIASDPSTFSSSNSFPRPTGLPAEAQEAADFIFSNTIVTIGDPPRHTLVRRILHEGFKPSTIARFEPDIRKIITKHVDLLPLRGSFDLAGEFAHTIPLEVGMYVTGFPLSENDNLRGWMADQVAFFAGTAWLNERQLIEHGRNYAEAIAYLRDLVRLRRAEPRDDLISIMTRRDEQGEMLTDDEVAAQTIGLIAAGWENTSNAITNIVRALLEDPPSGKGSSEAKWTSIRSSRRECASTPLCPASFARSRKRRRSDLSPSDAATGSSCSTLPPTTTRIISRHRKSSSSTGPTRRSISPSVMESTTVSAPRWPSSNFRSFWNFSRIVIPACAWPTRARRPGTGRSASTEDRKPCKSSPSDWSTR